MGDEAFAESDAVRVCVGSDQEGVGVVCGISFDYIVRMWIVKMTDRGTIRHDAYPYSCMSVPGGCLRRIEGGG